jgi:transcriptional regulator with XRE-family HTH domain
MVTWNGRRLRELREQAGLTQARLAERAGVTRDAVARWEAERREPGWSNVLALAAALGVTCQAFARPPFAARAAPGPGRPRKPPTTLAVKTAKPLKHPNITLALNQAVLTEASIMEHAAAHRRRTGRWPTAGAGPVHGVAGLTWRGVDQALRSGGGGLPGGGSLAALLARCVQQ